MVVDYDRCIGCRYCITACPYGARYFDFGENYPQVSANTPMAQLPSPEYQQFRVREKEKSPVGNVRKCTFCVHLQDKDGKYDEAAGRWPACAKTCTGHAIFFGDFNDPNCRSPETLVLAQIVGSARRCSRCRAVRRRARGRAGAVGRRDRSPGA